MATKEINLNGRDTFPGKSPLLKKEPSVVLLKDEHVKKKRKISLEGGTKPRLILENHGGKVRRVSSTEESWNITSISSPSRSPSPTKTPNSLKTTLKKIKKEGKSSFYPVLAHPRTDRFKRLQLCGACSLNVQLDCLFLRLLITARSLFFL